MGSKHEQHGFILGLVLCRESVVVINTNHYQDYTGNIPSLNLWDSHMFSSGGSATCWLLVESTNPTKDWFVLRYGMSSTTLNICIITQAGLGCLQLLHDITTELASCTQCSALLQESL